MTKISILDKPRHVQNKVKIHNNINETITTNDEVKKFTEFFKDNNLDTDLVKIAENKKINEYKKESLFHLLIFLEQQVSLVIRYFFVVDCLL